MATVAHLPQLGPTRTASLVVLLPYHKKRQRHAVGQLTLSGGKSHRWPIGLKVPSTLSQPTQRLAFAIIGGCPWLVRMAFPEAACGLMNCIRILALVFKKETQVHHICSSCLPDQTPGFQSFDDSNVSVTFRMPGSSGFGANKLNPLVGTLLGHY
jgi:hypothetical protein